MSAAVLVATVFVLTGCGSGGSQPDTDAAASQVASEVFATLTAAALGPTASPHDTPLPSLAPASTVEPMGTREVADDDSWYECWWQVTESWVHAGETFERALQMVQEDTDDGCRFAQAIADQLYDVKAVWDGCPLPSSPLLQQYDGLTRDALANEGLASMYFLQWCDTSGEEAWDTMLHFRSESARLAQGAQSLLGEAQ